MSNTRGDHVFAKDTQHPGVPLCIRTEVPRQMCACSQTAHVGERLRLRVHLFSGVYSKLGSIRILGSHCAFGQLCIRTDVPIQICVSARRRRAFEAPCLSLPRHIYRGASLIRKCHHPGPYTRTMSRDIWWPYGWVRLSYEQGNPVLCNHLYSHTSCPAAEAAPCCTGVPHSQENALS